MAVNKVVFFDVDQIDAAQAAIEKLLLDWKSKWFGIGADWNAELGILDSAMAMPLADMVSDEEFVAEVGALALNLDSANDEISHSPIVHKLGCHIVDELCGLFAPYHDGERSSVIVNPYGPSVHFALNMAIRGCSFKCELPAASVIEKMREPSELRGGDELASVSACDIPGNVTLHAVLQGVELKLKELFALEAGDVLTLEHALNMPMLIQSETGDRLFEARLVKSGNRKSMLLTGAGR